MTVRRAKFMFFFESNLLDNELEFIDRTVVEKDLYQMYKTFCKNSRDAFILGKNNIYLRDDYDDYDYDDDDDEWTSIYKTEFSLIQNRDEDIIYMIEFCPKWSSLWYSTS